MNDSKRKYERTLSNGVFKIYTSVTKAAYSVYLKDISKNGAFIRTRYLPEIGETITFVVLDDYGIEQFVGNAKVVRLKDDQTDSDMGFAILLEEELVDEMVEYLKSKKK